MEQMMAMLSGGPGMGGQGGIMGGDSNPMAALFAQVAGGGLGGQGIPGITAAGEGLADIDPANDTGDANMDPMAALMKSMTEGGGMPPGFGPPGGQTGNPFFPGQTPAKKPLLARFWPLVHVLAMFVLWTFVVFWWEPSLAGLQGSTTSRWALSKWDLLKGGVGRVQSQRLAHDLTRESSFPTLPVFWAFITIQVLLQSTRIVLFKSAPSLPSIVTQFLPLMPPHISSLLLTGSRYLSILNQLWKDGCLFIFLLGAGVILSGNGNSSIRV